MISKAHWKVFDTHDFFQLADWRRPVRKRHLFQFSCDFTVTEKVFKQILNQLMCNRRRTYAIRRIHTQLFAFINLTFSLPGKTNSISRKIWITTTWFNRIFQLLNFTFAIQESSLHSILHPNVGRSLMLASEPGIFRARFLHV